MLTKRSWFIPALLLAALAAPQAVHGPGAQAAEQPTVSGLALVHDGDSLRIGGERIRLHAMDAPELGQRCSPAPGRTADCGALARQALERLIAGRTVTCIGRNRDRYERLVATCSVAGTDLGSWMVAEGYAVAYRRFGLDHVASEETARTARRGL